MLEESRNRIKAIYDPEHFSEKAIPLISELGEYLKTAQQAHTSLLKPLEMATLHKEADNFLNTPPTPLTELTKWFLLNSRLLHSPHYMGHQVPAPIPSSSLFSLMSQFSNQGGAVSEMGPSLAAVERAIIKRMGNLVGWKDSFDGIVTNGGTLANLTALITARNTRFKTSWKKGMANASSKTPVILTSYDSHYSIARAAGIIGMGTEQVIKIAVNEKHQVTGETLANALKECENKNQEVFCVIASNSSTATGSFDKLKDIGRICNAENIWLHVDGAHGASVLFSKKHKHLVDGIELADSITWDAHKMLFVHSLSTILLYKNAANSFETFQQDAPYLFNNKEINDSTFFDAGLRTLECTRQALALPLWGVWSLYGTQVFEDLIDISIENAKNFNQLLNSRPDFIALHEPEANIQCFRYIPAQMRNAGEIEISELQIMIKEKLNRSGKFYITGTVIEGVAALRVTIMNPFIDNSQLAELLNTIATMNS